MTMTADAPRRTSRSRWFQFSLRSLLVAVAVLAVILAWPHMRRQYAVWRLQAYLDQDLQDLPEIEQQKVRRWVGYLVGTRRDKRPWFGFSNWMLHKSTTNGVARLFIVQMAPADSIPGNSYARIHIVDNFGRLVQTHKFNAGYRAFPKRVAFDDAAHGFECFSIETWHTFLGESRQVYRVTDKFVELLRTERLDGTFYGGHGNSFDLDQNPSDWSEWPRLIGSEEPLDQVRGLAAFWSWEQQELLQDSDRDTRLRLEQLSQSIDEWISEESSAALQVLDEHRQRQK